MMKILCAPFAIAFMMISMVQDVRPNLIVLLEANITSAEIEADRHMSDLIYASALSAEAVAAYASDESAIFDKNLYLSRMATLPLGTLASGEVIAWQDALLLVVKTEGLPDIPYGSTSLFVGSGEASVSGHSSQFMSRLTALDALFGISAASNDPGIEDAYEDTSVSLEMRHEIWERLVSEWGMTTLPEPVSP